MLFALTALLLAIPVAATATMYTYTYTGNALPGTYYDFECPYTDGQSRQFSITFTYDGDLLAPHAYNTTVYPGSGSTGYTTLDFTMSDGVTTLSSADAQKSQFVIMSVDSNGLPSSWWVEIYGPMPSPLVEGSTWTRFSSYADASYQSEMSWEYTYHSSGFWLDGGPYSQQTGVATNQYSPGTWSRTAAASVPEPGIILFLASGLLGIIGLGRKMK
jgi:hypothetical protein